MLRDGGVGVLGRIVHMGANPIFLFFFSGASLIKMSGDCRRGRLLHKLLQAFFLFLFLECSSMCQLCHCKPNSQLCVPHNALLWQLLTGRVVPLGAAGWWCCYLSSFKWWSRSGRTASVATLQVFLFLDYSNTSNPLSSTKSDKVTIIIVITS